MRGLAVGGATGRVTQCDFCGNRGSGPRLLRPVSPGSSRGLSGALRGTSPRPTARKNGPWPNSRLSLLHRDFWRELRTCAVGYRDGIGGDHAPSDGVTSFAQFVQAALRVAGCLDKRFKMRHSGAPFFHGRKTQSGQSDARKCGLKRNCGNKIRCFASVSSFKKLARLMARVFARRGMLAQGTARAVGSLERTCDVTPRHEDYAG